jgi:hypothetical protein
MNKIVRRDLMKRHWGDKENHKIYQQLQLEKVTELKEKHEHVDFLITYSGEYLTIKILDVKRDDDDDIIVVGRFVTGSLIDAEFESEYSDWKDLGSLIYTFPLERITFTKRPKLRRPPFRS